MLVDGHLLSKSSKQHTNGFHASLVPTSLNYSMHFTSPSQDLHCLLCNTSDHVFLGSADLDRPPPTPHTRRSISPCGTATISSMLVLLGSISAGKCTHYFVVVIVACGGGLAHHPKRPLLQLCWGNHAQPDSFELEHGSARNIRQMTTRPPVSPDFQLPITLLTLLPPLGFLLPSAMQLETASGTSLSGRSIRPRGP